MQHPPLERPRHSRSRYETKTSNKPSLITTGVLLDYWHYVNNVDKTKIYDPYEHHEISYSDLQACGLSQGIDIRPASKGGDIHIGDMLFIRSGFVSTYYSKTEDERVAAALRPHSVGKEGGQRWAGVEQEEEMIDWLHDSYFSTVAGDAPAFGKFAFLRCL